MGKSLEDSPSSHAMRFSVLLAVFSVISWSSMSSALAMSNVEGSSSPAFFIITAFQTIVLPLSMTKPKSRSSSLLNISAMTPTDHSFPPLIVKGMLLPL